MGSSKIFVTHSRNLLLFDASPSTDVPQFLLPLTFVPCKSSQSLDLDFPLSNNQSLLVFPLELQLLWHPRPCLCGLLQHQQEMVLQRAWKHLWQVNGQILEIKNHLCTHFPFFHSQSTHVSVLGTMMWRTLMISEG